MEQTLVDHALCTVRLLPGPILSAHCKRRTVSIMLSYLLFLMPSLSLGGVVLIAVQEGPQLGMLLPLVASSPFAILGVVYLRILKRHWGQVEIDGRSGTVRWTQKARVVGEWPIAEVAEVKERFAFSSSYRMRIGMEWWLDLRLLNGTRVPLMMGYADERGRVVSALQSLGQA